MTRLHLVLFGLLVAAASLLPLHESGSGSAASLAAFPGWPEGYEGRVLVPLPPAQEDAWLANQFPGRIARFSDGHRQIVLRWVPGATRLLHPASHCFRGAGYAVEPAPMRRTADGSPMSCFRAVRNGETLRACERIFDGRGQSWPDVSGWYWHALTRREGSGYWSVLEVSREPG